MASGGAAEEKVAFALVSRERSRALEFRPRLTETPELPEELPAHARQKVVGFDGPFTEAKEVVGGYAIFEAPSKAEISAV